MAGPYTVTVYTAMPGTPLMDDGKQVGKSAAGHMWYRVSDGETKNSYGFAPKAHEAWRGPGKGYDDDTRMYQSPYYSRTMEVSEEQYAKLMEYGEASLKENWRFFKGDYSGATNSCVDFTWGALKHADFQIHRPEINGPEGQVTSPKRTGPIEHFFEGRLQPARNVQDLQQLVDPVPGSRLSSEKFNPPPERTWFEKVMSENEAGTPEQRAEAQRFKDQLGERLGQLGMNDQQVNTLSAAASKEQTRYASQGDIQSYLLSKDGSTIALRQEYPPLREFDVGTALAKGEQEHWNEASSLANSRDNDSRGAQETSYAPQAQSSPQMDAPVLSRG